jgi:hypothetical protein
MPNTKATDVENAIVALLAPGGVPIASLVEVVACTPLDVNGLLKYSRVAGSNSGMGAYVRTVQVPYDQTGAGSDPIYVGDFFVQVIILRAIRQEAISSMRASVMGAAATIRDLLLNKPLITSPFASSPLRPTLENFAYHPQGFVSCSQSYETSVQIN